MRKQTRRKIWSTEINPIAHAVAGAALLDRNILDDLRFREYLALDAMTKWLASVNDWRVLADTLNITEMMGNNGIGPEALPACEAAEKALLAAKERYERTGKMGFDGPSIKAMRDLIEYADLQQSSISRAHFERMIAKTRAYIRSKGERVIVLE